MSEIKLQFLKNEANENEGLGHSGIQTYKDSPYASVARECGQNSSDARQSDPVTLVFDVISIDRNELPCLESLAKTFDHCLKKSREGNNKEDIDFFKRAKSILKQDMISVLHIADYNTTGLIGPSIEGTPFHSLVKSTGISNKEKATSGGSFGIGKNAVFAISDLQTVFYSTLYHNKNKQIRYLAQGKSILVSHKDENNQSYRAKGYWGADNFEAIEDLDQVPEWLHRKEIGTSIFALGFKDSQNWHYRMTASILRNFFVAIYREQMEFKLNLGQIQITKHELQTLFDSEEVHVAATDSGLSEELHFSKNLFICLTSSETKIKIVEIPGLGRVRIRILVQDDLPKRVCIVRNGMFITDSLEKFGDKLRVFRMCKDFVALVEPMDIQGSLLIKSLENPKHDGLSAERLNDDKKRNRALISMRTLAQEIRSAIKNETQSIPEKVQSLDELAQFFADTENSDSIPEGNVEEDPERFTYTVKTPPKKVSRPPNMRGEEGEGGGSDESNEGEGGTDSGSGPGSGSGSGGTGTNSQKKAVQLEGVRNIIDADKSSASRTIWFTPKASGSIILKLYTPGMNARDRIKASSTSLGVIRDGEVQITVVADDRMKVDVALEVDYTGSIEIFAESSNEGEVTSAAD